LAGSDEVMAAWIPVSGDVGKATVATVCGVELFPIAVAFFCN
jgi:hypothetical protein